MIRVVGVTVMLLMGVVACTDPEPRATPPASSASASFFAADPTVDASVPTTTVGVFFIDSDADPPRLVEVSRRVPHTDVPWNAVLALMAGPTSEEGDAGLVLVSSGASGVTRVSVSEGVARVEMSGECDPDDGPFTVADLLAATLTSRPEVTSVEVLGPGRSRCLEPRSGP